MLSVMKIRINSIIILSLLSFSTLIPALAYAAPKGADGKDWQYTNANSWSQTYSPDSNINKANVEQLEVKWIFPLAGKSSALSAIASVAIQEGSTTPPIVQDGKVFVTTNYLRTYAIDAKTGKEVWVHDYVIDPEEVQERLPFIFYGRSLNAHLHGIRYWESRNSLLINGMACDFYGIDIDTGETSLWVQDLCLNIPGNIYKYRQGTAVSDGIATYENGNQFIYVLPGIMHAGGFSGDARHVIMGIDMDTHQIKWRIFNFPPQDVPTKDWALQECDIGYFRDIPCSDVAAQAPENLEWDWAEPGETPSPYGGVTANWGHTPIVDEDTGILYTQTGNQGPFTYIGATPGPRLYGSTIMAIDMEEGERIWWSQPMPRDPYDYDCNWDGILADVSGLGKVYMKGCKEGRLHILDAETGELVHLIDVIEDQVDWGQVTSAALTEPYEGQGGIRYHTMDPFSYYDMREMIAPENSNYCGEPCPTYPFFMNGIFGTDMTYDPETATLYHYALGLQCTILESPPAEELGSTYMGMTYPIQNATIVARDVVTGEVKWTWFYDYSWQRAHMVVTKELVYTGFNDGVTRFFDKNTGELLHEVYLGSPQVVGLTTGQDRDGNQKIFTIIGISTEQGTVITPSMPGTVIALGLSDRPVDGAQTKTITTTTTSRTTLTSTSRTTLISTSATTSTVVSTAPAITTTVTSEVTEEVGLPAEITYAAVAVAVIAIVAAAVLMMRKK